jgi:hypothetical protein
MCPSTKLPFSFGVFLGIFPFWCRSYFLKVADPVSHPYEITHKTVAMYVLFFISEDRKCENKGFETEPALKLVRNAVLICWDFS